MIHNGGARFCDENMLASLTGSAFHGHFISIRTAQQPRAQCLGRFDMMRQGWSISLFEARKQFPASQLARIPLV